VSAAVRTADAIDRVQGREQRYERGGHQPSHKLIILCFQAKARLAGHRRRVDGRVVAVAIENEQ
jgi:hypothetical protein